MNTKRKETTVKNIVLWMRNGLLGEAIERALAASADFRVDRVASFDEATIRTACASCRADILLMDASRLPGNKLAEKLKVSDALKKTLPAMKVAVIGDTTADPDVGEDIKTAKQLNRIDAFFFESVTSDYLAAVLKAL